MKNKFLKTFLFLIVALFSINSARADFSFNDMELKFAQVTDVHISDGQDTAYKVLSHSKELFKDTVQTLNKIKGLDFVVFTGDMVDEPTGALYREFFTTLSKLNHPSLLVFGNHDSAFADAELSELTDENGNVIKSLLDKNTVIDIITRSNPYQQFGSAYFAFSPNKDYRVIVLDTTINERTTSNGYISEEQLNFLDNEISANQDKIIIIFQHHPVIEPIKSEHHKMINPESYLEVLQKYEKVPIAIFAGHYHAARIIRKGNVIHVASPSLVTYPNAFRVVNITNYNDRVIFQFRMFETNLKEIQEISKQGLIASVAFQGKASDRNNEIMIRKGYVPKIKPTKEEKQAIKQQKKAQKKAEKERKRAEKEAKKALKKQQKLEKEQQENIEG